MARLIDAVKTAEAVSKTFNISMDDLVDVFAKIPTDTTNTHVGTVNHPSHYQGANECIDVMRAMFGDEAVKGFCKCNAYKYRFRAEHKNGAEDIRKAEWYESYLIGMDKDDKGNG